MRMSHLRCLLLLLLVTGLVGCATEWRDNVQVTITNKVINPVDIVLEPQFDMVRSPAFENVRTLTLKPEETKTLEVPRGAWKFVSSGGDPDDVDIEGNFNRQYKFHSNGTLEITRLMPRWKATGPERAPKRPASQKNDVFDEENVRIHP